MNATLRPLAVAVIGIAFFAAMDAAMKGASIAIGAYSAFLLRCAIGVMLMGPVWWSRTRRWPTRAVMRVHWRRGVVTAFMGWAFFFGIVRVPLAEAIALSFIAPLIALYLASVLLGERVRGAAAVASLIALAGAVTIIAGRLGAEAMDDRALIGIAAVLGSAVLYAYNLVLQRQQALIAGPIEVSAFQNGIVALVLVIGAPFLLVLPDARGWTVLALASTLAIAAGLCLTWAYARAETQALLPTEYTAFLWASLFGWWWFGEALTWTTLAGTVLIVAGCLVATRRPRGTPALNA